MLLEKKLVVGTFQCNCYILVCSNTREAVVIDPGDEADRIIKLISTWKIDEKPIQVRYLLHTHAHLDHIGATKEVACHIRKSHTCSIAVHSQDASLYYALEQQGTLFNLHYQKPDPINLLLEDKWDIRFGALNLKTIHTPGHSPGSICFYLNSSDNHKIYTGDTLFYRSIGRADLWGGNHEMLIESIHTRLLTLDKSATVYPGHGPYTNIYDEQESNPFL
jgi:hydroxyacylglutathione hydrolase